MTCSSPAASQRPNPGEQEAMKNLIPQFLRWIENVSPISERRPMPSERKVFVDRQTPTIENQFLHSFLSPFSLFLICIRSLAPLAAWYRQKPVDYTVCVNIVSRDHPELIITLRNSSLTGAKARARRGKGDD